MFQQRYNIEETVFDKKAMVRLKNGLYPGAMISVPNIVEAKNGEMIHLYCHDFQMRGEAKVCYYYFSTKKDPPP